MKLDRRQLLAAGGACLASCGAASRLPGTRRTSALDRLLEAHAGVLPERAGAGANHYPMAAEALEAMGHEDAIDDGWDEGAAGYAGELPRVAAIRDAPDATEALGAYDRYGDWLDFFRAALQRESWHSVIARWTPRLAAGISGAAFHGVIRTGHAARALRQRANDARRNELAVGLAYWAARFTMLPTSERGYGDGESLGATLATLESPWLHDHSDVEFHAVLDRLTQAPIAPPVTLEPTSSSARADLELLVREAATAFLEMLVLERNRIWLLHTVTGPAAVGLLLPDVDPDGARKLVAYARQAVVAMYAAYGEPFRAREHLRPSPAAWPDLVQRAADSRSVHGIKLIDALARFDGGDDTLCRSVAVQWFEWT